MSDGNSIAEHGSCVWDSFSIFLVSVGLDDLIQQLPSVANVAGERQEAIDHILAGIGKLQIEVSDAADFTPSYDRKQYSVVRFFLSSFWSNLAIRFFVYRACN